MMRGTRITMRRRAIVALTAVALLASPIGQVALAAKAVKFTDACAVQRKPFERIKNYQLKKILGGVAGGALLGMLGAVVKSQLNPEYEIDKNGNKKKKGPDLVGGAIAGAAVGGLVGWFTSLKQASRNQEELQSAVNANFREDVDQFSPLGQNLADLGNCRRTQIFSVQQAYERKEIDAKTAGKQLDQIDKWIAEDDKTISKAAKIQTNTVGAYARATAMADGGDPATIDKSGDQMVYTLGAQGAAYEPTISESYIYADQADRSPALPPPPPPIPETRYVKAQQSKGVSLRESADPNAKATMFLENGTEVETLPSTIEGWLSVTAKGQTGFIKDSLLATEPPARGKKGSATAKPKAKPAQVVAKPPPGKAIVKLAYAPSRKQPVKPRDKATAVVANLSAFQRFRAQDTQNTSSAMSAARRALES